MAARCVPLLFLFCLVPVLSLVTCAPTKPAVELLPQRPVSVLHGDTLVYRISFADTAERNRFGDAFGRFVAEQRFSAERFDSAGVLSVFSILPLKNTTQDNAGPQSPAAPPEGAVAADTAPPAAGGSLRLYYPRSLIDYPVAVLVDAAPFGRPDKGDGYFTAANASSAAVTMRLTRKAVNGAGKSLNALDIIELWTRWIKEHPAEGLAAFRSTDGIMKYLRGEEAIVLGFSAPDKNSIHLKLAPDDPQALDRLRSPRLLPAPFKLGCYALAALRGNDAVLKPNPAAAEKPLVKELTVRCGGDANPLLSFSLGRYDCVLLWSARDIEYGRRTLMKNSTCSFVGRDRYFIACSLGDGAARAFVRSLVSGRELLGNFVKAEGALISAVESDSLREPVPAQSPAAQAPAARTSALQAAVSGPISILFRKDDEVSKIIAERLLAALGRAGGQGILAASDDKQYEEALVNRSFACAVGWAPETVLSDSSEKLRLASIFFGDEQNEGKRISEDRELPLFSIDWYLLARNKVGLYKGKLSGIYVRQEK